MREITIEVYGFDELAEKMQDKVVERLSDINVDHDWWCFTYADAEAVGLKITEFDLYRQGIRGEWIEEPIAAATRILAEHGDDCETHKTAQEFLDGVEEARRVVSQALIDDEDDENEYAFEDSGVYEDLCDEFLRALCEDYRIILQHEYDYLTSREVIVETIRVNEYEFLADGRWPRA